MPTLLMVSRLFLMVPELKKQVLNTQTLTVIQADILMKRLAFGTSELGILITNLVDLSPEIRLDTLME